MAQGFGKRTVCKLTLVVEYDSVPADQELEELVDKARELGAPVVADVELLAPLTRSLL